MNQEIQELVFIVSVFDFEQSGSHLLYCAHVCFVGSCHVLFIVPGHRCEPEDPIAHLMSVFVAVVDLAHIGNRLRSFNLVAIVQCRSHQHE